MLTIAPIQIARRQYVVMHTLGVVIVRVTLEQVLGLSQGAVMVEPLSSTALAMDNWTNKEI